MGGRRNCLRVREGEGGIRGSEGRGKSVKCGRVREISSSVEQNSREADEH